MPFRGVDMSRLTGAHHKPGKKKTPKILHITLKTLAADKSAAYWRMKQPYK